MTNQNEYRATHEEKNLVIRELRLLEGKWQGEKQTELRAATEKGCERIRNSAANRALAKRYAKLKQEAEEMEKKLRENNLQFHRAENGYYVGFYYSNSDVPEQQAVEKRFAARLDALSDLRTRIGLATYRSEVKALYEAALKL